jgi:hypothetical protein
VLTGRPLYAAFVAALEDDGWVVQQGSTETLLSAVQASEGGVEVSYGHAPTGARLHLRLPVARESSGQALLSNPLDAGLNEDANGFAELVGETHGDIVRALSSDVSHVKAFDAPVAVASVSIPEAGTRGEAAALAATCTDIAAETAAYHTALEDLAQSWTLERDRSR